MRSTVPLSVLTSTLLLFAACSPAATTPPPATPPVETATPGATASESPSETASPTETAGACAEGATGTQTVTIRDFAFDPAELTVAAGTTVTWTNAGATGHTATADDGSFDCGRIASGASLSFTFSTPGTFDYHCAIHPFMKGRITVT